MPADNLEKKYVYKGNLVGYLSTNGTIAGNVYLKQQITGQVSISPEMAVEFYKGPYDVIPDIESQRLDTKDRYMTDDVTVTAIPYFDVSNPSGGSTVYIGMEIQTNRR